MAGKDKGREEAWRAPKRKWQEVEGSEQARKHMCREVTSSDNSNGQT